MSQPLPSKDEVENVLNSALFCVQRIRDLRKSTASLRELSVRYGAEIRDADREIALIEESREVYRTAIDRVYEQSVGVVEEAISSALSFVFYDKKYSVRFEIGDNRNKTLEPMLYDDSFDPPRIVSMKDGVGNGVRSVLSFVLLVYYFISLGRQPIIFADEAYSAISAEYVDKFFEFVSSLCKEKGVTLVLITHDMRFLSYADRRYIVNDGVVTEVAQ